MQAAVLDPSGCCSWPPTRSSPPTRRITSPTSESRARWVTRSPSPTPRPAASPRRSVPRPGPRCSPRTPPSAGAGPPGCGGAGCWVRSASWPRGAVDRRGEVCLTDRSGTRGRSGVVLTSADRPTGRKHVRSRVSALLFKNESPVERRGLNGQCEQAPRRFSRAGGDR